MWANVELRILNKKDKASKRENKLLDKFMKKAAEISKNNEMNLREREWLILFISGAALVLLQTIQYVFLNPGGGLNVLQAMLNWVFSMFIIASLVHISFREIRKVYDQLVTGRVQANEIQEP